MSAAGEPLEVEPETMTALEATELSGGMDFFSTGEFRLTIMIMIFGLASLGVFYALLKFQQATPYTLRIFVVIILVFGTLLVVSSAYTTDQIAPVVGFFGTIAGYLLGRSEKRNGIEE